MGPLKGIKVIEMKGIGPCPYAGQLLADLGAEVVVVERSSNPSSIAPPSALDINSRGKQSIALDLKQPQGLVALLQLVEGADVIFEGNRPGVAEKLGFGPDVCTERNPKIIYGRLTGWGQTGPLANSAGHDLNYLSITGVLAAIGSKQQPVPPLNLIGDYAAGSLFLVVGILSALYERQQSGKGQVIDAAITDGSAHLMSIVYTLQQLNAWTPKRQNNLLDGGAPFYSVYQTSDKKFVSVAAIEPQFFAELISKAQLPDYLLKEQNNPAIWPEMHAIFERSFKLKTRQQWVQLFEGSDACVAGVLDYQEAINHPHNKARDSFFEQNGLTQPSVAPRFSRSHISQPKAPSREGADTYSVLHNWGFSKEQIERLDDLGILKLIANRAPNITQRSLK